MSTEAKAPLGQSVRNLEKKEAPKGASLLKPVEV